MGSRRRGADGESELENNVGIGMDARNLFREK